MSRGRQTGRQTVVHLLVEHDADRWSTVSRLHSLLPVMTHRPSSPLRTPPQPQIGSIEQQG